jgi:hypothetical protein
MGNQAGTRARPLARSLDPLTGESLGGYLLRLAHRLCLSPVNLARWIGCGCAPLSRRLLFDLDPAAFAAAARLSPDEAATLTLAPWADRYPPIARALTRRPAQADYWLFNTMPRYCPQCLAGDGSPVQEQHGGPWKRTWHLPVSFACPEHQVFLSHSCPEGHPPPASSRLITSIGDSTLHPAQCRYPRRTGWPGPSSSCGARLDQAGTTQVASHAILATQQRLLAALDPQYPAEDAGQFFTDLRVITALLCASWPASRELLEPPVAGPVAGHVRQLRSRASGNLSPPPENPVAAGALLTAAARILDSNDLRAALSRYHEAARPGRPSRSPWARIVDRHADSCSPALLDAAEPLVRGYRKQSGPHSPKAPARNGGYRPEHIPAFLEDTWFELHLAQLDCRSRLSRVLRRTAAATLVQRAAGGSLGDAAAYLGINPNGGQFAPTSDLYQWLDDGRVCSQFTAALNDLAADLAAAPGLLNYRHRRDALRTWSLHPGTWTEIVSQLPPVPGPVQPTFDDRKRQEASAFVWARVTQGELRFAPRPLEAGQPEPVRRAWAARHGATWHQLARPDPLNHYVQLRKLLTQHAEHLAAEIDATAKRWPA